MIYTLFLQYETNRSTPLSSTGFGDAARFMSDSLSSYRLQVQVRVTKAARVSSK